jgi:hypothetical protein
MGEMGYGYGSECHLLRWMGRHRRRFNERVTEEIGRPGAPLEWLDFRFRRSGLWPDAELEGMQFLRNTHPLAFNAWKEFWPQSGTPPTWDAVGWLGSDNDRELILLEAKARIGEDATRCRATNPASIAMIEAAFAETKAALGVDPACDWMNGFYQITNRLAVLYFLQIKCQVPARLLFLYFVGDLRGAGRNCPQTEAQWQDAIQDQTPTLVSRMATPWKRTSTPFFYRSRTEACQRRLIEQRLLLMSDLSLGDNSVEEAPI